MLKHGFDEKGAVFERPEIVGVGSLFLSAEHHFAACQLLVTCPVLRSATTRIENSGLPINTASHRGRLNGIMVRISGTDPARSFEYLFSITTGSFPYTDNAAPPYHNG